MSRVAYIGGGVLQQQLALMFQSQLPADAILFDDVSREDMVTYPFDAWEDTTFRDHLFVVAMGYFHRAKKQEIVRKLIDSGRNVPALIHPQSIIHPSVAIDPASVVYPGVNIGPSCVALAGAILLSGTVLAHDNVVGESSYLSPSVTLTGFASVGPRTFLGAGTLVANRCRVGADVTVGIGSVITRSLHDGISGIGNPFREKPIRLG